MNAATDDATDAATDTAEIDVVITLRLPELEAAELLAEVAAHRARDVREGHRDGGVLLINTQSIRSAVKNRGA